MGGFAPLSAAVLMLSSGAVSLTYDDTSTTTASLIVDGVDHLYEYGFYYVRSNGRVSKLEDGTLIGEDTIRYTAQKNVFVDVQFELLGATVPDVNASIRLINDRNRTIDGSVIFYFDYDLNETSGAQYAQYDSAQQIVTISDGSGASARVGGIGASAFQIDSYSSLRTSIEDGIALDNSGVPFGPGDATGAFQWDFSLSSGETSLVKSAQVIPESSQTGLVLAALVLLRIIGRRRLELS
jgi:hypothetical protein